MLLFQFETVDIFMKQFTEHETSLLHRQHYRNVTGGRRKHIKPNSAIAGMVLYTKWGYNCNHWNLWNTQKSILLLCLLFF